MIQAPVLLLLSTDVGPYHCLIPTHRRNEAPACPKGLADEVPFPFHEMAKNLPR